MNRRFVGCLRILFAGACSGAYSQTISRVDTIEYSDNLTVWVLGQVKRTTTNGVEVSRTDYDTTTALPTATYRFGNLQQGMTYNADGTVATVEDGNNNVTRFSSYKRGIPQRMDLPATPDQPSGTYITANVDDLGQILSVTDTNGAKTCYGYDAMGRVNLIQYPSETALGQCGGSWNQTQISFSSNYPAADGLPAGHWRQRVITGNSMTETLFDGLWRPVVKQTYDMSNVNATISQTVTRYDTSGNVSFESYPQRTSNATVTNTWANPSVAPNALGTSLLYDALNRVTSVTQDAESSVGVVSTKTRYLPGFKTEITDPKQHVTTLTYMTFDQPATDWPVRIDAPGGVTQVIGRDIYGSPTSITQSGLYNGTETDSVTKTLTYDPYHRLCRMTEPESGSTVVAYDNANNVVWSAAGLSITGAGCGQEQVTATARTTRSYDAMNRLMTILPPSGTQSTQYAYTPLGQPSSVISGVSTWIGSYNHRGMLTGESLQLVGQNAWGLRYAYDANGSLSSVSYPNGETVSYTPDALGRPTQAGGYASAIGYFPNGQVSQFVYGNGAAYVAEQNVRQMPKNFSYGTGGTAQLSEDLSYDANGNITAVTDLTGGPRGKSFGYDELNRLTSAQATGLWGSETYTYDPINNLRTRLSAGQALTYNYDVTNKLASISNGASTVSSFQYDNRGNVTNKNGTNLLFDLKNQLTQIPGYDSYAYDAAGRRVTKTPASGASAVDYFYDQAGQLMYQFEPATTQTTNFIHLGSILIASNAGYTTHVLGVIDGVNIDASNNAKVSGWACSTGLPQSIGVEVFAGGPSGGGGTRITTATANVASEPAVATACQSSGAAYRFSVALTSAIRSQYPDAAIYMYGDSPVGAGNLALSQSGSFKVPVNVPSVAPSLSVPSNNGTGSYTVSWGAVSGATSYTLQEQVNGGGWSSVQTSASTSWSVSGKGNGSYGYQVQGCNASGCSPWSSVASTTVLLPPPAPASITIPTSSSGNVAVSWAASATATSYILQHADYGVTGWNTVYNGSATNFTQTETVTGTWIYQVQACNTGGCSAFLVSSSGVTVTTPPGSAPSLTVPASSSNGSYTVSWGGIGGASSYTLQEQVNGGSWTTIQSSSAASKAISGKANGSYGYHVQACNVSGCGPWSVVSSTTVTFPPPAPTSITIPVSSSGSVAVSWPASATATSYTLQHANYGITGWSTIYSGSATSYTQHETVTGAWIYQVQACNAGGCSAFRVSSSGVTVTIAPVSAPSLTVPATSSTGSYTVSWGAVSGATSYTLQEQVNSGAWATIQASNASSKAITGKSNGSYGYRVQACNAGGCGPWSSTGTAVVALAPPAPTSVQVITEPGSPTRYLGAWAPVSGATRYEIFSSQTNSTIYSGTQTSFIIETVSNGGRLYMEEVRACNASGCSAYVVFPN